MAIIFYTKDSPLPIKKYFILEMLLMGFCQLAQGAAQSIESAFEIFNLLKNDKLDKENNYFEIRSKRAKIVRNRSNFNFLPFTFQTNLCKI